MPKETTAKPEAKKEEEPVEFLTKVGKLGYPLCDVSGKFLVIPRDEENLLSIGFQDANGRRQIVITGTKELWSKFFTDGLAYISGK